MCEDLVMFCSNLKIISQFCLLIVLQGFGTNIYIEREKVWCVQRLYNEGSFHSLLFIRFDEVELLELELSELI